MIDWLGFSVEIVFLEGIRLRRVQFIENAAAARNAGQGIARIDHG
jgi:hypothetical protein